ncbi:MAG: hypothetical protein HY681_03045 [Chloroflexi bacterium]|nr:hypothetical protein [Chloroflexota bacterium]
MPRKQRLQKKHAIMLVGFAITFAGMITAAIVSGDGHPDGMDGLGQAAQGGSATPSSEAAGGITLRDLNRALADSYSSDVGPHSLADPTPTPALDAPWPGWPFSRQGQDAGAADYPKVDNPLTPSS